MNKITNWILIFTISLPSYGQWKLTNQEFIKLGLETSYLRNEGKSSELKKLLIFKYGLKLRTDNELKPGTVEFIRYDVDSTNKDNYSIFSCLLLPNNSSVQLIYGKYISNVLIDTNTDFIDFLDQFSKLKKVEKNHFLFKGGSDDDISSLKYICGVKPTHEYELPTSVIFSVLKNSGEYTLNDVIEGF